jgi:hypothetical protein
MKKLMLIIAVLVMVSGFAKAQMEAVDPVSIVPVAGATYPLLWMDIFSISSRHGGTNVTVVVEYFAYRYITNVSGVVVRDFAPADPRQATSPRKRVKKTYTEAQVAGSPVLMQWVGGIINIADTIATQEGLVKP